MILNKTEATSLRKLIDRFDQVEYEHLFVQNISGTLENGQSARQVKFKTPQGEFTCFLMLDGTVRDFSEKRIFGDWSV